MNSYIHCVGHWLKCSHSCRFFILGALLAILLTPGNLFVDAERRLQVTRWIWSDEPQVREDEKQIFNRLPGRDGQLMAQFGIGQSLVMLPADLASAAILGKKLDERHGKMREMIVYYLTFPAIAGLALAMARRNAGWVLSDARQADFATLIFALCSSFLVYCRDTHENILMYACVFGGIFYGLNWVRGKSTRQAATMAAFFGFLILIRIPTVTVIAPFCAAFAFLAFREWGMANKRRLASGVLVIGLTLLCFVSLDRLYHWYRFGEITRTYADYMIDQARIMGYEKGYPMGYPLSRGLFGFFLDPRKSAVLFDPLLIISTIAVFLPLASGRLPRTMFAASFGSILLTACLYGRSHFWHGDTSWGPRHLNVAVMPAVLFGVVYAVSYLSENRRSGLGPVFKLMVFWGLSIQLVALPLYHELELDQWKKGYPIAYPPVLRVCNLAARAVGTPDLWNLDCNSESVRSLQALPLQFTPFQIARALPGNLIAHLVIVVWLAVMTAFAIFLSRWALHLFQYCMGFPRPPPTEKQQVAKHPSFLDS